MPKKKKNKYWWYTWIHEVKRFLDNKSHSHTKKPKTLKYWVGVQRDQSYLMGRRCLFSLDGHPSSDGVTIKMPYGVNVFIDQLRTPSFPIGLVKTESGFILRSVETSLGRWTLVVAVISVDAYHFFDFFQTWPGTLRIQE